MLGADTVVVHPPFRWQLGYSRIFADTVKDVAERHDVVVAVENMFGWCASRFTFEAYAPGWNPGDLDVPN